MPFLSLPTNGIFKQNEPSVFQFVWFLHAYRYLDPYRSWSGQNDQTQFFKLNVLFNSALPARIVGDDDGGTMFTPDQYEDYKRRVLPMVCVLLYLCFLCFIFKLNIEEPKSLFHFYITRYEHTDIPMYMYLVFISFQRAF